MEETAEVHPYGPWPITQVVTVIFRGKTYPNVPLIWIESIPTIITVRKESYPGGVVILYETPPPGTQGPITLPVKLGKDEVTIPIEGNVGWPSGVVVLWEDQLISE